MTRDEDAARHTAYRLSRCLAQCRVPSRVVSLVDLEGALDVALDVPPLAAPIVRKQAEALAHAAGVSSVQVSSHAGYVHILVPRESRRSWPYAVPIGATLDGRPVELALDDPATAHTMVAGLTGGGKTTLLRTYVHRLTRRHAPDVLRLILSDVKREAFGGLDVSLHLLHPIITDAAETALALAWLSGDVDRRIAAGESAPRIVCVVDELADVVLMTGGASGTAAGQIARVAALGRSVGVHLTLATQHPRSDVVGGSLATANIGCRIVGRVASAGASHLVTGQAGVQAHRLPAAPGWFARVVGGETTVFRADEVRVSAAGTETDARLPLGASAPREVHPSQRPTPITDEAWRWIAERATTEDGELILPGIGRIRRELRVGVAVAEQWQRQARERLSSGLSAASGPSDEKDNLIRLPIRQMA